METGRGRPNRLVTDSWEQEKHQGIKRRDRHMQRSAWKKRGGEETVTPLPCPWRDSPGGGVTLQPARVLASFKGDLWLVRFIGTLEEHAGIRVLRGGIPWETWGIRLLRAYAGGLPVPEPFRLVRRLPPDWLEKALHWDAEGQRAFFGSLRENGFLLPLRTIGPEAVASWLSWDEVRARFIDFEA